MQNPEKELPDVVTLVTAAINPEVQKVAVERYYAPNAAFRHPLCRVWSGPGSRNALLGILQWYRIMSPLLKIEVENVTYNAEKREAFLEVAQIFHIRYSPLRGYPARLIVHLRLQPSPENRQLLQIAEHEDFYHPDEVMALVIPPLIPIIQLFLWIGTIGSIISARIFQIVFGFWRVTDGEGGKGAVELPSKPEINGTNIDEEEERSEPRTD